MDEIDLFFAKINRIWRRLVAGENNAEAEFWSAVADGERRFPDLLDQKRIAKWVSGQIVEETRNVGRSPYEEAQYYARIQKIADNLQHPFLLLSFPSMLANDEEDPLQILDGLVAKIGAGNLPDTAD